MANTNPIHLDQRAELHDYTIPVRFSDTMIYLAIKVKLQSEGWKYAPGHSIYLEGDDIYKQKFPEPVDLKIGYGKQLEGLHLDIRSHISRFRDGSDDSTPSKVDYALIIEAGDELLDEFTLKSDTNNPSDFNSFIQFKLN